MSECCNPSELRAEFQQYFILSCEERGKRKREGGPVWDERREEEQTHGAGGGKGREC